MYLEVKFWMGFTPGVRESRGFVCWEVKMRKVVYLVLFLVLCVSVASAAAETSGQKSALRFLPKLEAQLNQLGSQAKILDLSLLYEAGSRDLLRGDRMYLTTWNVSAQVGDQTFEILNLNILVTNEDKKGLNRIIERLALEIAKRAIEVSRVGK